METLQKLAYAAICGKHTVLVFDYLLLINNWQTIDIKYCMMKLWSSIKKMNYRVQIVKFITIWVIIS